MVVCVAWCHSIEYWWSHIFDYVIYSNKGVIGVFVYTPYIYGQGPQKTKWGPYNVITLTSLCKFKWSFRPNWWFILLIDRLEFNVKISEKNVSFAIFIDLTIWYLSIVVYSCCWWTLNIFGQIKSLPHQYNIDPQNGQCAAHSLLGISYHGCEHCVMKVPEKKKPIRLRINLQIFN